MGYPDSWDFFSPSPTFRACESVYADHLLFFFFFLPHHCISNAATQFGRSWCNKNSRRSSNQAIGSFSYDSPGMNVTFFSQISTSPLSLSHTPHRKLNMKTLFLTILTGFGFFTVSLTSLCRFIWIFDTEVSVVLTNCTDQAGSNHISYRSPPYRTMNKQPSDCFNNNVQLKSIFFHSSCSIMWGTAVSVSVCVADTIKSCFFKYLVLSGVHIFSSDNVDIMV